MQILRALKDDKDKEIKKMVTKVKRKRKREKMAQSGQTAPPGSLTDAFCKMWDWITNTQMGLYQYVKLEMVIYGHPATARAWTKTRDACI